MEYKSYSYKSKNTFCNGKFSGYANIFNLKDYYNDIILPSSFSKNINTNCFSDIKLLFEHNNKYEIGFFTKIEENEIGLFVEGIIDVNNYKNIYNLIKNDKILGLSIGYKVLDYYFDKNKNRIIKSIDLKEISLVKNPANKLSKIIYCK